ncbi:MAG: outer membrane protein transport protein [Deferrisomatales bacterium]
MGTRTHKTAALLCLGTLFLFLSGQAHGAGFAIVEQSVSGLGNAFAGGAASAEDATTIFFNPAGMTRLGGQQAILGGHVIIPSAKFENQGSTHSSGAPLTGGDGGDGGVTKLVPNAYYTIGFDNGLALGLGVSAPFGLATDYDDGWVGRYHALESDLKTVILNPSVAYRVADWLSVGAGVSAMYVDATLSSAVDFGLVGFQAAKDAGVPDASNPFAAMLQAADGEVELSGNQWEWGFNLGVLVEFNENTRLGAAYRSRVKCGLKGDADFTVPSTVTSVPTLGAGIAATFADTDADVDITLPDTFSLSLYHRYNQWLAVMADVTWTNWSVFDELKVEFQPNEFGLAPPDSVTTENWEDSWRFSAGATINPTPAWPVRVGVAYDQTPIPDAEHRTPRIPGEDRFWVALGTGYRVADWFRFDVGYAHLFVKDGKINKTITSPTDEDASRGALKGEFDNSVDIVSAQVIFRF